MRRYHNRPGETSLAQKLVERERDAVLVVGGGDFIGRSLGGIGRIAHRHADAAHSSMEMSFWASPNAITSDASMPILGSEPANALPLLMPGAMNSK